MPLNLIILMVTILCAFDPAVLQALDDTRSSTVPRKVMLASTIGPIDAGIVGALEEAFAKETGIIVEHQGAGTGQALKMAETGKFDLVLVHARALEDKFVTDGFGTKRYDLMYNDFVIVGPKADPASVRGMKDAAGVLRKIASSKARFVTRGDRSGTHVKELEVWEKAGILPRGSWYITYDEGFRGNAATLVFTDKQQAYTIMDRATYITLKSQISLQVLVEKDDILLNYISLIPVNPVRFPMVHYRETMQFVEWLQGREAQTIIRNFGKDKYGEPLFFPNSPAGRMLSPL